MKIKTKEFLEEIARWDIKAKYECGRIVLREGNDEARAYYSEMLKKSPEFEGALIWELAQTDENIMDWIDHLGRVWRRFSEDSNNV